MRRRNDPSHKLQMTPTEQWKASCFAAGPLGPKDIATRDRIGVETIMFGSDFIHVEGTYPHSRQHMTKLLVDVSPADRYAICTGNGARILGVDLDVLAKRQLLSKSGPSPSSRTEVAAAARSEATRTLKRP